MMLTRTLALSIAICSSSLLAGPPTANGQDYCWGNCPTDRPVVYLGVAPGEEALRRREAEVAEADRERAERLRLEADQAEQIRQRALQQQRDQQRSLDQQDRATALAERARAIRRARQQALANPACRSATLTVSCE